MKKLLLLAALSAMSGSFAQAILYVDARNGSDNNDGSVSAPFATIHKARSAVRELKKKNGFSGATVEVTGNFDIPAADSFFSLSKQDSGLDAARPIVWQAGKKGATITGAHHLKASDFKIVADESVLERLRPEARGKVWECDLKKLGVKKLSRLPRQFTQWSEMELFAHGKDMTIARYPNTGWLEIPKIIDRGVNPVDRKTGEWENGARGGVFAYEGTAPERWDVAKGVYMKGFWCHDWSCETLRVAKIDTGKKEITSEGIHKYGIGNSSKWHTAKRRYIVYNLLEELDAPGEWFVDREKCVLYFMPDEHGFKDVYLSMRKVPLVSVTDAKHIVLRGFKFKYTTGDAVNVAKCDGVILDDIEVSYTSSRAIAFSGCFNSVLKNSLVYQIGGTGVSLSGGNRKTLVPGNNRVTNCEMHHCARLSRISGPCLTFNGCGNTVDHNYFHDTPYIAVTYGGNNHVFEFNEIACAMMESGDGGGVYTGRDWGSQGNIVRWNHFHHFGAAGVEWRKSQGVAPEFEPLKETVMVMGLYLDDCDSGDTVYGNIFHKAGWAMFCGGGRDNKWRNNLALDCTSAAQLDVRGLRRARPGEGTKDGWDLLAKIQSFDYKNPPWSTAYPWLVNVMENDPKLPIGTEFTGNVAVNCREFLRIWENKTHPAVTVLKEKLNVKGNLHFTDKPMRADSYFVQTNKADAARVEFRPTACFGAVTNHPYALLSSPEFKAACPGFPEIPLKEIGLRKQR
jgi:hypothetical protein